jgi:hypothetical protein
MDVIRTIKPGKPGSVRFYRRWREKLVAVRYRHDARNNKIYTTIEIIVDEREQAPPDISLVSAHAYQRQQPVALPIAWEEHELRARAKQMGARWSRLRKVWLMRYQTAVVLGIRDRIVPGLAEECTDVDTSYQI